MQEAEKKAQAQLQILQAEKQASAEQLKAAQSDIQSTTQQLHSLHADKQAAHEQLQSVQGDMQAVKQRLDRLDADKQAAAKQLQESKAAHEQERACWQQQQQQWEAERGAKAEREEQLQRDMAAMQATLAEYKAALAAAQTADKGRGNAMTGEQKVTWTLHICVQAGTVYYVCQAAHHTQTVRCLTSMTFEG